MRIGQPAVQTARVFRVDTTGMDEDTVREMTAYVADAVLDFVDRHQLEVEDEGDE